MNVINFAEVLLVLLGAMLLADASCLHLRSKVESFLKTYSPYSSDKSARYAEVEREFGKPTSFRGDLVQYVYPDCSVEATFSNNGALLNLRFSTVGAKQQAAEESRRNQLAADAAASIKPVAGRIQELLAELESTESLSSADLQRLVFLLKPELVRMQERLQSLELMLSGDAAPAGAAMAPPPPPPQARCTATTTAGKRCTRAAEPKSKFCWQHKSR